MLNLHLVAGPGNSQHEDQRGVIASEGGHEKDTTRQLYCQFLDMYQTYRGVEKSVPLQSNI